MTQSAQPADLPLAETPAATVAASLHFLMQELELARHPHASILVLSWGESPLGNVLSQRGYQVFQVTYLGPHLQRFTHPSPPHQREDALATAATMRAPDLLRCDVALGLFGNTPRSNLTPFHVTTLLMQMWQIMHPGGLLFLSVPHLLVQPNGSNPYTYQRTPADMFAGGFTYQEIGASLAATGFAGEIGYGSQDMTLQQRALRASDPILNVLAARSW